MTSAPQIAVIGLGAMGSRMAQRLLGAGHPVFVYNRTPAATERLAVQGARVATTARDAVRDCDVVISCVRDDEAVRALWLDAERGALAAMKSGAVIIESSTLTPACARELAAAALSRGVSFLDAPVVGSRPQAEVGQLIYLVGGDGEALERVRSILNVLGAAVHHVGALGTGASLKLAVNALFTIQVAAVAEILALTRSSGIEPSTCLEILGALPVTSAAAKGAGALMLLGKHEPMFPIDLVVKDLGYVEDAAVSCDSRVPLTSAVRVLYARARDSGVGGRNVTAVSALYAQPAT